MEDSFKVRVDRAFGSLEASSSTTSTSVKSTSSTLSSLWCLTDEEIERNKWIQDKIDLHKHTDEDVHRLKIPKPYSPFLQGLLDEPSNSDQNLESDIQELDDEEDDNQQPELCKPDDHNNEEWDIRSSVGMDCTLDNEEEEDAYDKVAVGKEESTDRFYMKSVNDYEVEIDSINELPDSIADVIKDPRANHMAAKLRLKEDDESAKKLGLHTNNIHESIPIEIENQIATNSKQHLAMNKFSGSKTVPNFPQSSSSLPDHVRNPSKYTRYMFDSNNDFDEESNRKAFTGFFDSMKGSNGMEIQDDVSNDSLSSIIFTPKKKLNDDLMKKSKVGGYEEHVQKKIVPISIVDSEICMMDEEEPEIGNDRSSGLQKGGRRYRIKGRIHDE